jgi:YVTN family beta-propeller protein
MNTKSHEFKSKINFTMSKQLILPFLLIAALSGCKPDDDNNTQGDYEAGVFITNEGPFGTGTGTVSFYNRTSGEVSNNIFEVVNNRPLGNIVNSIEVHNGKAYIVVNNGAKVEVVNVADFVSSGAIENLGTPRFFLGIDDHKGYLTDWASGIKVIDLHTNSVTSTIATGGSGAEQMKLIGSEVFVANSGGYDKDSTVAVINTATNAVTATFTPGHNPKALELDANGKLWILCNGILDWVNPANDTPGKLVRVNPATKAIEVSLTFGSASDHPAGLVTNEAKTKLYYTLNGGVYEVDINATTLPSSALINRSFYNIGIDPESDHLFGSNAMDFVQNGYVVRYTLSGTLVDSFQVGIIPGNFYFN